MEGERTGKKKAVTYRKCLNISAFWQRSSQLAKRGNAKTSGNRGSVDEHRERQEKKDRDQLKERTGKRVRSAPGLVEDPTKMLKSVGDGGKLSIKKKKTVKERERRNGSKEG